MGETARIFQSVITKTQGDDSPSPSPIGFLSVGTQILSKDLMDQYIRNLGNYHYRTHYGMNAESALRILEEKGNSIQVIITEYDLADSSAYHLIQTVRKRQKTPIYFILAIDQESPHHQAIAQELEIDSLLIKPFTAKDLKAQIETYQRRTNDAKSLDRILFQAQLASQGREYQKEDKLYQAALKIAPRDSRAQYRAGLHFLSKPDYPSAEKHLRLALELDPKYIPALSALGLYAFKKKDFKLAHALWMEAQSLSPLNPDRPILLARLRLEWGSDDLKRATLKYPENSALQLELGKFLVFQRDYASAVQVLRKIRLSPDDPNRKELEAFVQWACQMGSIR